MNINIYADDILFFKEIIEHKIFYIDETYYYERKISIYQLKMILIYLTLITFSSS